MTKSSKGMSLEDYESVGTTFDGIRILKPVMDPVSFTTAEIRETIARVLGNVIAAETGDVSVNVGPSGAPKNSPARRSQGGNKTSRRH